MRTLRLCLALVLGLGACSDAEQAELPPEAARGRSVYLNVCIACHHADPNRNGTVGPAIAGSSRELVESMVLRAEYPPGYTPKRDTNAMPRYPQLADEIDSLVAYLAAVAP